ncbi:MAG: class I SAM-dependent methyltransferase [Sphingomonas sp.]
MKRYFLAGPLALMLLSAAAPATVDWLTQPGRSANSISADASRKPVEVLTFLGIKKGDAALDYGAGGGYYTDIMAQAVGPKGSVTAWDGGQFKGGEPLAARWRDIIARHPNVSQLKQPIDAFSAPAGSYGFALLHLVYHDLYWESVENQIPRRDPDALVRALFIAMKRGGIVGVVDHAGPAGDTRALVEKTHRIDPAVVMADFKRAGFVFVGKSDILRMPADDYSKDVFQPENRGKSDRFILKFKKP